MAFIPGSRAAMREPARSHVSPIHPLRQVCRSTHHHHVPVLPHAPRGYSTTPPPTRQIEVFHPPIKDIDQSHLKHEEIEYVRDSTDTAKTIAYLLKEQEKFINPNAKMSV